MKPSFVVFCVIPGILYANPRKTIDLTVGKTSRHCHQILFIKTKQ